MLSRLLEATISLGTLMYINFCLSLSLLLMYLLLKGPQLNSWKGKGETVSFSLQEHSSHAGLSFNRAVWLQKSEARPSHHLFPTAAKLTCLGNNSWAELDTTRRPRSPLGEVAGAQSRRLAACTVTANNEMGGFCSSATD